MELKLVYYPDPPLRRICDPVPKPDDDLREAVPRMFEIMYRARGIGLAAAQGGIGRASADAIMTVDGAETRLLSGPATAADLRSGPEARRRPPRGGPPDVRNHVSSPGHRPGRRA